MTKTQKYRQLYWIFRTLSIASVVVPLVVFIIMGYADGGIQTAQKVTLSFTVVGALVLTTISFLSKRHIRSTVFILLLGIYAVVQKMEVVLITISVCVMADEFIFTPIYKKYGSKLKIRKEIADERREREELK